MPPRQIMPKHCGCIVEVWGMEVYTTLCPQHLAIMNNQGHKPPQDTTQQQGQTSRAIQGTQLHPSGMFQMGEFGRPVQMPLPVVHTETQQQETNK